MEGKLYVRNWVKFQHYKDRCPPWIKLATDTFQNYEFSCLQDASKLLAIGIWTLASRCNSMRNGEISWDFDYIKSQLGLSDGVKLDNLQELIDKGFLLRKPPHKNASKLLAPRKQNACLEGEAETEGERIKKGRAFARQLQLEHATNWVCQELGLSGPSVRNAVALAMELEVKTSTEEIQTIAEIMVRARRNYDARPRGRFHYPPLKFFQEGIWKASREYTNLHVMPTIDNPAANECMMPDCKHPPREGDRFCSDLCKDLAQKLDAKYGPKGTA